MYFPAAVIRDGRMLFYYNGGYGKKIPDEAALKKIITEALADQKKYVVIIATDIDGFVARPRRSKHLQMNLSVPMRRSETDYMSWEYRQK